MLTVEKLKQFGADTNEGLTRCLNNETFYLSLVNRFLKSNDFDKLKEAINRNDLEEGFKAAHALKGVLGNLSLTPLYSIIFEMTDLLRNKTAMDYSDFIKRYEELYNYLLSL